MRTLRMDIRNGEGGGVPILSSAKIQTMTFIMNALEDGWKVKKRNGNYIFEKKHENKREVFKEDYLEKFVYINMTKKPK